MAEPQSHPSGDQLHGHLQQELQRRRNKYFAACEEIRRLWNEKIAHRNGPLPGASLDPFITTRGWAGHVQASIDQAEELNWDGRRKLASLLADVYELPQGAVLVDDGWQGIPDTAFIWAYRRPGVVDYHERLPHSVFKQEFAGRKPEPGQLTDFEVAELRSWTHKYLYVLRLIREEGHHVDMERLVRRYNRMRGAILDALTRATPGEILEILAKEEFRPSDLGDDIAEKLGLLKF